MSSFEVDLHSARLSIRRAELQEVDDSGEMQVATALGYDSETFKNAHRVQSFGASSHPPKGSHGLVLVVNGRPDQSVHLGDEHPDYRPRDLPEGAYKIYDKDGTFVYLDAVGNVTVETRLKATVKAGQEVLIEAPTIRLKGDVIVEGNITQTGGITSTGAHQASAHI
jgi:phage baseplate assembly protein V